MTTLAPRNGVLIQNDSGMVIPPRSVVVVTSVEITTTTSIQEGVAIHHVTQYTGQAGNILVTGRTATPSGTSGSASSSSWWSSAKGYGRAYTDTLIYVSIDPTLSPPTAGEQWGPTPGQWFITRGGANFFSQGAPAGMSSSSSGTLARCMFFRGSAANSSAGGGGGSGACSCCSCLACLSASQALVGGCSAAPNGAPYQDTFHIGTWAAYPALTPGGAIQLTYGQAASCSGSSSGASASSSGSGCVWYACPQSVCISVSSSSSSSSSSSCGTYQFTGTITTDGSGNPQWTGVFVLLSGGDVLGIA